VTAHPRAHPQALADDSTRATSTAVWQALGRLAGSAQVHLQAADVKAEISAPVKATETSLQGK